MHVLHISKYYYPYVGGVENICQYIVDGLSDVQSSVVCFNEGPDDCIDEINGHTIYRVGAPLTIARQALSLHYGKVLERAIREQKPNIIHFHWANPFPAMVLLRHMPNNVRLIVHWHMDIIRQKLLYPFVRPVERKLLERADRIIVTSPNYRDGSRPLQPFRAKIRIVPNAIQESLLAQQPNDAQRIRQIQAEYEHKPIIFFVGRHIHYKGLPFLIEAERMVKSDCVFVIAGNGPLTPQLKKQCHSDRVYFVGRLSDDELRWYLHAASIFAFPSITKNEAFGVALAEAMYCSLPAVTFTIPESGVNWVCPNHVCGLEAPNSDAQALADNIDTLLHDDNLRMQLGDTGRKRVMDNFMIANLTKNISDLYEQLLC